jgi:hypothetical protein
MQAIIDAGMWAGQRRWLAVAGAVTQECRQISREGIR